NLVNSRRWDARSLDISEDCNLLSRRKSRGQRPLQREGVSVRLHDRKDAGTGGYVPRRAAATTAATTAGAKASNRPDGVRVGAFHNRRQRFALNESDPVGKSHQAWIALRQDGAAHLERDLQEEAVHHRHFHALEIEAPGDSRLLLVAELR